MISESTGPIFTRFSLYGRHLLVHYHSEPNFSIAQGTLPWQPILWLKSGKSPLFVAIAFQKGLEYHHSALKGSIVIIWMYMCKFGEILFSNPGVYEIHWHALPHFKMNYLRHIISGSTGPIFTKF